MKIVKLLGQFGISSLFIILFCLSGDNAFAEVNFSDNSGNESPVIEKRVSFPYRARLYHGKSDLSFGFFFAEFEEKDDKNPKLEAFTCPEHFTLKRFMSNRVDNIIFPNSAHPFLYLIDCNLRI